MYGYDSRIIRIFKYLRIHFIKYKSIALNRSQIVLYRHTNTLWQKSTITRGRCCMYSKKSGQLFSAPFSAVTLREREKGQKKMCLSPIGKRGKRDLFFVSRDNGRTLRSLSLALSLSSSLSLSLSFFTDSMLRYGRRTKEPSEERRRILTLTLHGIFWTFFPLFFSQLSLCIGH